MTEGIYFLQKAIGDNWSMSNMIGSYRLKIRFPLALKYRHNTIQSAGVSKCLLVFSNTMNYGLHIQYKTSILNSNPCCITNNRSELLT